MKTWIVSYTLTAHLSQLIEAETWQEAENKLKSMFLNDSTRFAELENRLVDQENVISLHVDDVEGE